jgi:hypothetical protein
MSVKVDLDANATRMLRLARAEQRTEEDGQALAATDLFPTGKRLLREWRRSRETSE